MSENVNKKTTENEEGKKRISEKNLAVIITAGILAVILIVTAVISLVQAIQQDVWFDYLTSDLDDYIEMPDDYKNFKVNIDLAKAHDIDIDVTILNMLYEDRSETPLYGGSPVISPITITSGDTVNIWYRGYILDEDGEKVYLDNMCNFSGNAPFALNIGSNSFVPGFEYNLIGKNTGDSPKFEKITEGDINEGMVLYVNYSIPSATDSSKMEKKSNVRLDLSEDLDAIYGAGFKKNLMKLKIGGKADITSTLNDKSITYKDLTVSFATACEKNPLVIECYFPYDYSKNKDLLNETAYFEIYTDGVIVYDCPEFTDEYLKKKIEDKDINLTLEELNKYEGATLVEKYYAFAKKTMDDIYETSYDSLVETAVWNHFSTAVKVKKYPASKVEEVYNTYIDDLSEQFLVYGGQAYDSTTGQYKTYDTLEAFIPAYLGLPSTTNWKTYITEMAQSTVKERMIMYYLLRNENLIPSEDKYKELLDEIHQEYLDEYIAQYLKYEGKTKDDYTEEEYAELVEDCREDILTYYTEEFYMTRIYYGIVAETFIDWPEVSTLDDRRAYPFDK